MGYFTDLSIVVPVGLKETPGSVKALKIYLKQFWEAEIFFESNGLLWDARRNGISKATRPVILNLDVDTRVPIEYVDEAIQIILNGEADAVSIDYAVPHTQGHLAFGASIWDAKILKNLYDFSIQRSEKYVKVGSSLYVTPSNAICECLYMWKALTEKGKILKALHYDAEHLRR